MSVCLCVLRSQTNLARSQAELRIQWCISLHIYIFYLLKTLPRLKLSRSRLFTWLLLNVAGFWETLLHRCSAWNTCLQVPFFTCFFFLSFFFFSLILVEKALGAHGVWNNSIFTSRPVSRVVIRGDRVAMDIGDNAALLDCTLSNPPHYKLCVRLLRSSNRSPVKTMTHAQIHLWFKDIMLCKMLCNNDTYLSPANALWSPRGNMRRSFHLEGTGTGGKE